MALGRFRVEASSENPKGLGGEFSVNQALGLGFKVRV